MQGSAVGSVLRLRPVAVILGQGACKSLFIHAGLPLQLISEVVQQSSSSEPNDVLDKLNTLVKGALPNRRSYINSLHAQYCMSDAVKK